MGLFIAPTSRFASSPQSEEPPDLPGAGGPPGWAENSASVVYVLFWPRLVARWMQYRTGWADE
jgi:hypothetical protein